MDDGLLHRFGSDPELIRLLIEHAERLAECLRQFKSIDSRDHGSSDVNAALQGIVTAAGDIVKLSKPSGKSQPPAATPLDIGKAQWPLPPSTVEGLPRTDANAPSDSRVLYSRRTDTLNGTLRIRLSNSYRRSAVAK